MCFRNVIIIRDDYDVSESNLLSADRQTFCRPIFADRGCAQSNHISSALWLFWLPGVTYRVVPDKLEKYFQANMVSCPRPIPFNLLHSPRRSVMLAAAMLAASIDRSVVLDPSSTSNYEPPAIVRQTNPHE